MSYLDDCTVWCWRGTTTPPAAEAVLSAVERERAAAFARSGDQVRSATAAGLLRLAAATYVLGRVRMYDVPVLARTLRVDRTCPHCGKQHGRPDVGIRRLHVSVSHTGSEKESVVLVAVSSAGAVGVDAEMVTGQDFAPLASQVLSPAEIAAGAPADQRGWFATWCRKEAVLKATGDGLTTPMSELVFEEGADGVALASYAGGFVECDVQDLSLGDDVAAAVAVLYPEETPVVSVRDAAELLR